MQPYSGQNPAYPSSGWTMPSVLPAGTAKAGQFSGTRRDRCPRMNRPARLAVRRMFQRELVQEDQDAKSDIQEP